MASFNVYDRCSKQYCKSSWHHVVSGVKVRLLKQFFSGEVVRDYMFLLISERGRFKKSRQRFVDSREARTT